MIYKNKKMGLTKSISQPQSFIYCRQNAEQSQSQRPISKVKTYPR